MKNQLLMYFAIGFLILFSSCDKTPDEIRYGDDQCNFCQMTIVDKAHAAQLVTDKGKQFKFDAIECMINQLIENKSIEQQTHMLVADFGSPGSMVNAEEATYLVSEQIKSPMGANLSAFKNKAKAKEIQEEYTGNLFDWNGIIEKFKNK